MNIKQKAFKMAYSIYFKQMRNSESNKVKMIHILDVVNILEKYGFDDNLIAAAYLHEFVEYEKYNEDDLRLLVGQEIYSFIVSSSENDSHLRKKVARRMFLDKISELDFRHKVLICADKISSLENIKITSGKKGIFNLSDIMSREKIEEDRQYYTDLYNALIQNENSTNEIFIRLRDIIYELFYDKVPEFIEETSKYLCKNELTEFLKLYYKKIEIKRLIDIYGSKAPPFVIEFSGIDSLGKSNILQSIKNFFEEQEIKVSILNSLFEYDENFNSLLDNFTKAEGILCKTKLDNNSDIIMLDNIFINILIYARQMVSDKKISKEEYEYILKCFKQNILDNINNIFIISSDYKLSIENDYNASQFFKLSDKKKDDEILRYNRALYDIVLSIREKKYNCSAIDITRFNKKDAYQNILDIILDAMRKHLITAIIEYTSEINQ